LDNHTPVRGLNNEYFIGKRSAKKDAAKSV
jgi:hypothetical protein